MANPRTTEQKRAERALKCVRNVKDDKDIKASEYVTLAKRAPANIQTNGLGQTLAFWRSKRKDKQGNIKPEGVIYEHVSSWVCKQMNWQHSPNDRDKNLDKHLLVHLTQCSTGDYRRATVEAMAFLSWLKRFAEAELGDD
jgi:CRISPR-associated protein Cmr5